MATSDLESYKQYVSEQLNRLTSYINQYAEREIPEKISIPEKDDELSQLYKGLNLIGDRIRKLIHEKKQHFSEWKRTEKELRQYKRLLASTQHIAQLGSWELDLSDNKLIWSDEVYRIFGLELQEFAGTYEAFLNMVHPNDRKAVSEAYEQSIKDGRDQYEIEHRIIRKNTGEIRYVHEKCEHIRDESGSIIKSEGMVQDITGRKQTEFDLQKKNEELETTEEELLVKNRISNTFINSTGKNFYKEVLDIIRKVLSSEYGYFGYINDSGDLVAESMTKDVWNECQIEDKSIVFPKNLWGGLWGKSLKERKTLYQNGNLHLPEGHVQLKSAIVAPIVVNNILIGQIALANKTSGYDNNDKKLIRRLCDYIAPLLHSKLKEEQYKQELMEAKDKAEENEALLQAAMKNSRAGIAIAEAPSGKLRFGNEAGLSILNENYEDLKNNVNPKNYEVNRQVFHLDGTPYNKEEFPLIRAASNGETCSREFLISRGNNATRYVLSNASPVINAKGKQTAAIAVFLDITARKKAEEKIRKSEAELAAIYENAPFIMMLLDRERRVRKINRFGEKFTGTSSEKLIGLKGGAALQCINHLQDPRGCGFSPFCSKCPVNNTVLDTFETGRSNENIEGTLPFLINGEEKALTLLISTSFINIQEEPLVLVSILDITSRKNAERALAEREEKYRQIFNNTNDGMYLHKISDKGEPGNFIEVNDVACNMLGYSRDQLLSMSPGDIDDPVFASHIPYFTKELQEQGQVTFETRHVARDGSRIPVEVSAHLFELNDEPLVLSAVRNITERKQAEENVYRSLEKEKELNHMKTRFISMVSHEFRTPLANIYSNIQMFQRYENRLDSNEKSRYFERIHSAVSMLNSMLDDISLFSKKENNRLKLHPVQIEINNFFQNIMEETLTYFDRKNNIIFNDDCSIRQIVIDRFLLKYVVNNLLSNALKYSDSQVNLYVKCLSHGKLSIRVEDKGRGIPQKHLEHIFDPFFRSDNTGTIRGTGLGLAIVKHCVDLLNGEIHIDSKINQGTRVTVDVPYQIPES
ncbi:MAG: PAS domain S-box protein [Bacteroidales bacterium]|nr:PAS domain S-box protein [Bacteroidales bacterium]